MPLRQQSPEGFVGFVRVVGHGIEPKHMGGLCRLVGVDDHLHALFVHGRTRSVPIRISRVLMLRRSLGGHGLSSHEKWCPATTRFPPRHARHLCMHEENSSIGVPRHLWHSCDKYENRAKIVPWGAVAPASLARVRPPGSAHMPESPWAAPLHRGGRDTRDDGAMGRRRRVPGGTRHDWRGLRRGLQGVRRRTHALEVASRYVLGVVATDCRNRAVK
jgi:hypothetical protein